ncbi:c-type cytochrome [Denitrobaculum tricleocarpae]|uniref:C-type cytochrome n=1 Tax=Denitrobaculum tricleocarpae TaxID=2591009 RepID=A0A545TN38_9PROT|nr:c-type cytochrome [Denitrobaculum tricleocarpae]TQV78606.1 c-type cytochrome [Denitrobaculum tricleocarpae]
MLKFPDLFFVLAAALCLGQAAWAESFDLGREATPEEVAAWDIDVRPDGRGLPVGSGSVTDGEEVFIEKCAVCHGDFGEGVGRWPVLAGGQDTLAGERPVKTIGSYWPYLSTVWDYVHRAMPFGDAQSLSDDEVYAITAYLLYMNDVVDDEDFVLSKDNFADTRLPNEGGFFMDDRHKSPIFARTEVCMTDCKETVEITMRARVLDVTPDQAADEPADETMDQEAANPKSTTLAVVPEPAASADPGLVTMGEKLFRKCKACHQVGDGAKNRVGPVLTGIVGRPVGTVEGFRYSKPMAQAGEGGLIWDHKSLGAFLADPKSYMPKTKMSFSGLRKQEEIDAILAYLASTAE